MMEQRKHPDSFAPIKTVTAGDIYIHQNYLRQWPELLQDSQALRNPDLVPHFVRAADLVGQHRVIFNHIYFVWLFDIILMLKILLVSLPASIAALQGAAFNHTSCLIKIIPQGLRISNAIISCYTAQLSTSISNLKVSGECYNPNMTIKRQNQNRRI